MKELLMLAAVVLLAVLAWRVPTADEIGSAVLHAREREQSRNYAANSEANERQAKAQQSARRAEAQQEFDGLAKWDAFGRPINRTPPAGLLPTANIAPAPRGTYGNPL